jgi:hypothetical protein
VSHRGATSDLEVEVPGAGPVVLAGPPGRLRGKVQIRNVGAERISLHRFDVSAHDLPGQPGAGQLGVRLPAGGNALVTASFGLPSGTPPGEYHATLVIAGHQIESVVHVVKDPSLDLLPSKVFVDRGITPVQLVARNTGNVRLQIAPLSRGRLSSDADVGAVLGPMTSEAQREEQSTAYDAVLRIPGMTVLEPGEVSVVSAEVEVDTRIDAQRRHLVLLPVATATLRVVAGPMTSEPEPGQKRGPRTAARQPRRKNA